MDEATRVENLSLLQNYSRTVILDLPELVLLLRVLQLKPSKAKIIESRVAMTWHEHADTPNSDTTRHGNY